MRPLFFLLFIFALTACQPADPPTSSDQPAPAEAESAQPAAPPGLIASDTSRFDIYALVPLQADLGQLSENQKEMVSILIDAAKIMDDLFWRQVWGDPAELLDRIDDSATRRFVEANYGPWDRLADDQPFIEGFDARPPGVRFYPEDMTRAEFEAWEDPDKDGLYSLVRRGADRQLELVPYRIAFAADLERASVLLLRAAELAEDPDFAAYLRLRAAALINDDYQPSDLAWMEMKDNDIELVYGPIETYQDRLFGYRAAFEAFVLLKDLEWSQRLDRFAAYLPELQRGLPVDERYKAEVPGSDADLGAYDLLYCAGDCNSGSKTIAINLPNDEEVQLAKGTRRIQIKNAMRAKFDQILVPLAEELIAEDQRGHITFDAFFGNTMFHEVAHGLGIKNVVGGEGTVRQALREHASALEEGKADVLGLYMVQELRARGEIDEGEVMDNYVTFLAGIFRSIRFGASSAHGRANMIRFNYFERRGAFSRDPETGTYRVEREAFEQAVADLSRDILVMQGNGDYSAVDEFVATYGDVGATLQSDLDRLANAGIPVDIVYRQGKEVLGL